MRVVAAVITAMLVMSLLGGCSGADRAAKREQELRAAAINVQLGLNYLQANNLDLASQKLERALEQDPRLPAAHYAYALLQERIGRDELADRHYRRAVALDPKYSDAFNAYGVFLCRKERLADADAAFRQALDNPLYGAREVPMTNAGICMQKGADKGKAEDYFRRALEVNPNYGPALFAMAEISFRQERYLQTRAYLQRFTETQQNSPRTLWLCVKSERAMRNWEAAGNCALRLKNRFPDSGEAAMLHELESRGGN